MFVELYRSKVQYFRKHFGRRGAIGYKAVLVAAALPRMGLASVAMAVRPAQRAKWRVLLTNYSTLLAQLPALYSAMRILFVTQVLPLPLDAGPKVRAYYVLRYLAEAGHDVHLVSFVRPGDSAEHIEALRRLCGSIETVPIVRSRLRDVRDGVRSLWTRTPFLVLRDDLPAMRGAIRRLAGARSFDAIHADQLWMAPYGMHGGSPIGLSVLDQHNAVFQVPRRMAEHHRNPAVRALLHGESARLEAYEREACRRFDRVVWVTDEDRRAVLPPGENRGAARLGDPHRGGPGRAPPNHPEPALPCHLPGWPALAAEPRGRRLVSRAHLATRGRRPCRPPS